MNRRSFLRGLIAAPAIVAASSIMPVRAIERFNEAARAGAVPSHITSGIAQFNIGDLIHVSGGRSPGWYRVTAVSDADYAAELSCYHCEPRLRDTAEPQAPVSPDKEKNQFPTADQDDTRQSAHVSDTLIPNSACRLSRSWGASLKPIVIDRSF
jgi:hypothetical protein